MYAKSQFTTNVIRPGTGAMTFPPASGPLQPWERKPELIGAAQPFAEHVRDITVAAFAAEGETLPPGPIGYVCRVDSEGGLTRIAEITGTVPIVSIRSPMRFVIEKVETTASVGFDIDGFFSVGASAE